MEFENYFDLLEAKRNEHGDRPFIIIDSQVITYSQFYDIARARAISLMLRIPSCSVKKAVLVLSSSFLDQATAFIGLQGADIIPILTHNHLEAEEQLSILHANGINALWSLQDDRDEIIINRELLKAEAAEEVIDYNGYNGYIRRNKDIVGVLSSGTTGIPKVMYRSYESWAGFFPEQNRVFDVNGSTRMFIHGSLSFTGNLNLLLGVMYAGGTIVTTNRMSTKTWSTQIRAVQVNSVYLIPSKLQLLANGYNKAIQARLMGEGAYTDGLSNQLNQLSSVRNIITGSQLLSGKSLSDIKKLMPNARIVLYYGASELSYITYAVCSDTMRDPENLGLPFNGIGIEIDDSSGRIIVTTDYHISGVTVPFTIDDTGYVNPKGELIFQGRSANWINKGGCKLSSLNISNKLKAIDGIRDAVVIPYDDELRGNEIAAFIVPEKEIYANFQGDAGHRLKPTGTEENFERRMAYMLVEKQLRQVIRSSLPKVEIPEKIILIDGIPLMDSGKSDMAALNKLLADN